MQVAEDKIDEASSLVARSKEEVQVAPSRQVVEARPLLLQRRPRAGPEGRPPDGPRRPRLELAELLPHVERARGPRPHDAAFPRLARNEPPAHAPAPRSPRARSPTSCSPAAGPRSPPPETRLDALSPRSSSPFLRRLFTPRPARAQSETPSPEILQELKQRLTRPAPCEPKCVTTPSLVLRIGDSRLQLSAEVHAAADGTWPLPGPVGSWTPAEIRRRRRTRRGRRATRLWLSPPAPPARRPPRRGRGPRSPRRQLHPAVRRPAAARAGRGAGMGRQRPARRRPRRAVDPPHPPPRRPRRRTTAEGRYAPWLEVTRTLASASRGPSRRACAA